MKIEGDGQRIESRTKIGGGSGQYDLQRWLSRFDRQLRHGSLLARSNAAITASGSAGSTKGDLRSFSNSRFDFSPRSCEVKRSPRWKFSVYSGSLSRWPVKINTTVSLRWTNPEWTNFLRPASVTAAAGSQPMPSAPI